MTHTMNGTAQPRRLTPAFDLGFHGDRYLLTLTDRLLASANAFIETGANVGSTARYVARKFPHVRVFTCEPDAAAYAEAARHLRPHANASVYHAASPAFLHTVHREQPQLLDATVVYWLDSHGYGFEWPLREEVAFITKRHRGGTLLIDDCEVPGRGDFQYCAYDGRTCNFELIQDDLAAGRTYDVVYPAYSEHTSPHHPLVGYVAIGWGDARLARIGRSLGDFKPHQFQK
jgi:hypothetical protein